MEKIKIGDSVLSCMFRYGPKGITWTGIIFSKVTQINDARNITVEFEWNGQTDWATVRKTMVRKSGMCHECKHRLRHLLTDVCNGRFEKFRK